jgi:hypothetical protein
LTQCDPPKPKLNWSKTYALDPNDSDRLTESCDRSNQITGEQKERNMNGTSTQTDKELLLLRDKYIAFGYVMRARKQPSAEEIADMALVDWGLGDVFDFVVEQLGLVWEEVDGHILCQKNPQHEIEQAKAREQYRCLSLVPPFEESPELLDKSLDELLDELKSCQEVYGIDGQYDPTRVEALLWAMCYRIASVMREDHCDLLERAAYAIAYQHKTHPTAVPEWKDAGMKMCDRVLGVIYETQKE